MFDGGRRPNFLPPLLSRIKSALYGACAARRGERGTSSIVSEVDCCIIHLWLCNI